MAEFSKLVVTKKGQALIAKILAGTAAGIDFTKVVASDAEYQVEELESLDSLNRIMQEAQVSRVSHVNEVAVKVETAFSNHELTVGYHMRVLGLYARDPDDGEILYAACVELSGNCYMPPYNEITVSGAYIQLITKVGNADQVNLEVNPAAIATIGDIEYLQKQIKGHISDSVTDAEGVHGLRFNNDELQVKDAEGHWKSAAAGTGEPLDPDNMITVDGGGELFLPDSLVEGPYEIEFTEDETAEYALKSDLSKYALLSNPIFPNNIAVGAFATGSSTEIPGNLTQNSIIAGYNNTVNARNSITIGHTNFNYSNYNLVVGGENTAFNSNASCIGQNTVSNGNYSLATGYKTIASHLELVAGKFNVETQNSSFYAGNMFVIGIGSSDDSRTNGFRVSKEGWVYGVGAFNSSGADYAEIYEWADGNPDAEDRCGRFVILDGESIRLASPKDNILDILGIVSAAPSVVGDVHDDQWRGMYLRDIFGRLVYEDVEIEDPENPGQIIIEHRRKLNPAYDHTRTYIPQSKRPEKSAVGLLGKLVAVDDGTCRVNGWATVGEGGIATDSETRTRFRVMARLDDTHIRINIMLQ